MAQVIVTTVVWGFGFVAVKWVQGVMPPVWLTTWRLTAVFLAALPVIYFWRKERAAWTWPQWRLALVPGVLLSGLLVFQTWGMAYTTVTNSSFITTLYVVIVPVMSGIWLKSRISLLHWFFVALATIGTALICDWASFHLNPGDFLVLITAFLASAHMIYLEKISGRVSRAFTFNAMQSIWAAAMCLPFAFWREGLPDVHMTTRAGLSFGMLVIFCSLIGFTVQISAQRVLSASFVSVVFLLESPFAALFGWWLLDERPSPAQLTGAALIFAAALGACLVAQKAPE